MVPPLGISVDKIGIEEYTIDYRYSCNDQYSVKFRTYKWLLLNRLSVVSGSGTLPAPLMALVVAPVVL